MKLAARRHARRARRLPWILALQLLACAPETGSEGGGQVEAPPAASVLSWPAIESADRYELRAWAGNRLLFEQELSDTLLVLGPSLRRSVVAFDSVEVVVRGLRLGERLRGEPLRWYHASPE